MSEEEIYDMIHQEMSNHYFDMHKYGRRQELRAMFAGMAMQGILASMVLPTDRKLEAIERVPYSAVFIADALLAELERREG